MMKYLTELFIVCKKDREPTDDLLLPSVDENVKVVVVFSKEDRSLIQKFMNSKVIVLKITEFQPKRLKLRDMNYMLKRLRGKRITDRLQLRTSRRPICYTSPSCRQCRLSTSTNRMFKLQSSSS